MVFKKKMDVLWNKMKSWDKTKRHALILNRFAYERSEDRDSATVFEYSCPDKCRFADALERMAKCVELKKWQTQESCAGIVRDIEAHQDEFLPAQLDGIRVDRLGRTVAFLRNTDEPKSNVTGVIDYDDLRKEVTSQLERKFLEEIAYKFSV